MSRTEFMRDCDRALKNAGLKLKEPVIKAILAALSEADPEAEICRDKKGNPEPDSNLRDTKIVPLPDDITPTGEKRRIDLLAQVKWRGEDSYFLIHLENQAYNQKEFERRMFNYFARLDAKFLLPIFPIVIFSYDEPKRPEKSQYVVNFPNRQILEFNYFAIQLNNLNWRNFLNQPNPVAAALMAKMDFKPQEKIRVKLECLRMLVTLNLSPAKIELISGFIDTYLRLNKTEEQQFDQELKQANLFEEEQIMKIVTSWMEKGIEQGFEREIQQD